LIGLPPANSARVRSNRVHVAMVRARVAIMIAALTLQSQRVPVLVPRSTTPEEEEDEEAKRKESWKKKGRRGRKNDPSPTTTTTAAAAAAASSAAAAAGASPAAKVTTMAMALATATTAEHTRYCVDAVTMLRCVVGYCVHLARECVMEVRREAGRERRRQVDRAACDAEVREGLRVGRWADAERVLDAVYEAVRVHDQDREMAGSEMALSGIVMAGTLQARVTEAEEAAKDGGKSRQEDGEADEAAAAAAAVAAAANMTEAEVDVARLETELSLISDLISNHGDFSRMSDVPDLEHKLEIAKKKTQAEREERERKAREEKEREREEQQRERASAAAAAQSTGSQSDVPASEGGGSGDDCDVGDDVVDPVLTRAPLLADSNDLVEKIVRARAKQTEASERLNLVC
jgi:hypothetical protein